MTRDNNFDLLRLLAALQVVITHSAAHLRIDIGFLGTILGYFPGVPVFFTISGFLIAKSFDNNRNVLNYIKKRILRIYPALWVCFLLTLLLLICFHVISVTDIYKKEIFSWILSQISFFQFYTPDSIRPWGVGTPNGSLWTITVELQFYCIIPLIILIFKRINMFVKLSVLFVFSYLVNVYINSFDETIIIKFFQVSVLPHLFNFLIGSVIYFYWGKLKRFFEHKFLHWFFIYVIFFVFFSCFLKWYYPSYYPAILGLLATVILSGLAISIAYSNTKLSDTILKGNDLSYGMYIYHMLVVNTIIQLGFREDFYLLPVSLFFTVILALFSWILIEKRALNLKNKTKIAKELWQKGTKR